MTLPSAFRLGRIARTLDRWRRRALNLLFPPCCAHCGVELGDLEDDLLLCGGCREKLAPSDWVSCPYCGAAASALDADRGKKCGMCRGVSLRFDAAVSLGLYRSELGTAVLRMKDPKWEPLSAAAGRLYCLRRGDDLRAVKPDVVVPVPMFWARRMFRGTNSPDILAERVARFLRVPMAQGIVFRRRNTLPQSSLPPRQRWRNVRGAFGLRAGYDWEGACVLLVDDILTTGATCSQVAGLLKRAGAARVAAAVLARGVGDRTSREPAPKS